METHDDKREYEIAFLSRTEQGKRVVEDYIRKYKGDQGTHEEPRRIVLAYPIQKETSAFFGVAYAFLPPDALLEMEKEMKLDSELIRFLVIKEPIRMARRERDERAERDPENPTKEEPKKQAKDERAVTNEELEKKLQEILG